MKTALALLAFLVVTPTSAGATVRSGSVNDGLDMQRPSLNDSYYPDVVHAEAAYDDLAGTVRFAVTFARPDAADALEVRLSLTDGCEDDAGAAPELAIQTVYDGTVARLTGFEGSVRVHTELSEDGRTYAGTVSHRAFAGRDWRCVTGSGGSYGDRDGFAFYFAGFAPVRPEDVPQPFTPKGYKFCGWWDHQDGGWTYVDPADGVFQRSFARGMTCRAARLNVQRIRYSQRSPYRPYRTGYVCRTVERRLEYSDTRCVKRGRPNVAFRFQMGA